jgi:hypothetical protein
MVALIQLSMLGAIMTNGDVKNQEAAANDLVLHAYHGWSGF